MLAAPAPVLRLASATASVDMPLPVDGTYRSGYRQSIYAVPVEETERATARSVIVVRARSSDRRSLEYYRWGDDTIVFDGAGFAQDAPNVAMAAPIRISVTDDGEQWIEADGVRVALLERFGANVVTVTPASVPRLGWLLAHLAPR